MTTPTWEKREVGGEGVKMTKLHIYDPRYHGTRRSVISLGSVYTGFTQPRSRNRVILPYLPYSGKFSNGANFRIILKRAGCTNIKTFEILFSAHVGVA